MDVKQLEDACKEFLKGSRELDLKESRVKGEVESLESKRAALKAEISSLEERRAVVLEVVEHAQDNFRDEYQKKIDEIEQLRSALNAELNVTKGQQFRNEQLRKEIDEARLVAETARKDYEFRLSELEEKRNQLNAILK